MDRKIEMEIVRKIWDAEGALRQAIDEGVKHGVLVEIITHKYSSGTESLSLLVKQLILPQ